MNTRTLAAALVLALVPAMATAQGYERMRNGGVEYVLVDSISCDDGVEHTAYVGLLPGSDVTESTYIYGVDLCSQRAFMLSTQTVDGPIVRLLPAQNLSVWAKPSERSGFTWPRLSIGTAFSRIDVGTPYRSRLNRVHAAASLVVAAEYDRFRLSAVIGGAPSWTTFRSAQVTWVPFARSRTAPFTNADPLIERRGVRKDMLRMSELCNSEPFGIRGVLEYEVEPEDGGLGYIVRGKAVSFCTNPYYVYNFTFKVGSPYFTEMSTSYPRYADWKSQDRRWYQKVGVTLGYGRIYPELAPVVRPMDMLTAGVEYGSVDGHWRFGALLMTTVSERTAFYGDRDHPLGAQVWNFYIRRNINLF